MANTIITISRQVGSGGKTIGNMVAEKLGIPCYDSETIIEKIVAESDFARDFIEKQSEEFEFRKWFFSSLGSKYGHGSVSNVPAPQDKLWKLQKQVIEDIASQGPCIIIGRCADCILRDREDLLKIFITAPEKDRVAHMKKKYGGTEEEVLKELRQREKHRKAYYNFYTDQKFGDISNYHLIMDSGKFGLDRCVDTIVAMYQ